MVTLAHTLEVLEARDAYMRDRIIEFATIKREVGQGGVFVVLVGAIHLASPLTDPYDEFDVVSVMRCVEDAPFRDQGLNIDTAQTIQPLSDI